MRLGNYEINHTNGYWTYFTYKLNKAGKEITSTTKTYASRERLINILEGFGCNLEELVSICNTVYCNYVQDVSKRYLKAKAKREAE